METNTAMSTRTQKYASAVFSGAHDAEEVQYNMQALSQLKLLRLRMHTGYIPASSYAIRKRVSRHTAYQMSKSSTPRFPHGIEKKCTAGTDKAQSARFQKSNNWESAGERQTLSSCFGTLLLDY